MRTTQPDPRTRFYVDGRQVPFVEAMHHLARGFLVQVKIGDVEHELSGETP
jgi:hypothetical protein